MRLRRSDFDEKKIEQYVRNSRFKETADGWFFLTREGITLGPYECVFDAEVSASLLITRLAQLDDDANPIAVIQDFFNDPSNPIVRKCDKTVDLVKARRKQRIKARATLVQRAWHVITSAAALQRMGSG